MGKIARYLNQLTVGNVFDTPEVIEAYSTDRSILKVKPKYVALPESTEDIRKLMRFCYQLAIKGIKIPVTVWGSGLDEMGADLTNSLVISTEKMNRLLESDRRERLVRVQAGITLKELNTALSMNGLTIPIDGHENETIGGLISNCPTDNYSGKYGGIMNYVDKIEVVLANGDILQTGRISKHAALKKSTSRTLEGSIYGLTKIFQKNQDLIKRVGTMNGSDGYPTVAFANRGATLDLMPLFFGAQGTLGIITEIILHAVPLPRKTRRIVASFEDLRMAKEFLNLARSLKPCELNLYDIRILKTAEETGKKVTDITKKIDSGYVVFAKFDQKPAACINKLLGVRKVLPKSAVVIAESNKTKAQLDEFENSLVSFLNQSRNGERVPLVTDFYIPSENLPDFLADIAVVEKSLKLDLAIFGSYAAGNYSLRPRFNVEDEEFGKQAMTFLRTLVFVINRQGGSITGGSPEGRVKALVTNESMPEDLKKLYTAIKTTFDRYGILNPGVKLGADSRFTLTHFREKSSAKITV